MEQQSPTSLPPQFSSKLRLVCSYGGRIMPRRRGKSLCYVGGDTRLVVVERATSLHYLSTRLSHALLDGRRRFALKYQLPGVDLDSLVSVSTDEDLENMIEEYDRTVSSPSSRRLRLFLFPLKPESTRSIGPILQNLAQCEGRFTNALNGGAGSLTRGVSDSVSVNRLLGLDDDEHFSTDTPAMESPSAFRPISSAFSLSNFSELNDPVGIEDHFVGMKKQGNDYAITLSPPEKMAASGERVTDRVLFDDERSHNVTTFQMPSFSTTVSDHKISSLYHKPGVGEIQNSGYYSKSEYEKQQSLQFKTAETSSCLNIYQPRPHHWLEHHPTYYTPVWPIHAQMADLGVYGMPSATDECSSRLVHVSANQGMPTVMVAARLEFPETSSANVLG